MPVSAMERRRMPSGETGAPLKSTVPPAVFSMPTTARAKLDLPLPDSPTRATVSPAATLIDTPFTATTGGWPG
jgi:hypothetical protein